MGKGGARGLGVGGREAPVQEGTQDEVVGEALVGKRHDLGARALLLDPATLDGDEPLGVHRLEERVRVFVEVGSKAIDERGRLVVWEFLAAVVTQPLREGGGGAADDIEVRVQLQLALNARFTSGHETVEDRG